MIVDDTPFNIVPVKHMIMEHFNIDCDIAENGRIAVDKYTEKLSLPCKCKNRVYPLIIMDIGMPVMDGKEASKLIL